MTFPLRSPVAFSAPPQVIALTQIATINGAAATHDARGNLTSDPATGKTYSYLPSDNQLWIVNSPWTSYGYDATSRLAAINVGGVPTNLAYDGIAMIAEYDGAGALQKRYVFGPGVDEPLVEYDSAGNRRFLEADERGSIILVANQGGATIATNRYGEFGKPQSGNVGRFQYTGQMWLPNAGLYHYKLRAYAPQLGRFVQTDPIGYWGGPNLYAYVGNDPVNLADPLGLQQGGDGSDEGDDNGTITVWGWLPIMMASGGGSTIGGSVGGFNPGQFFEQLAQEIIVTAPRPRPRRRGVSVLRFPPPYTPSRNYCGGEGGVSLPSGTWNRACYNHDICYGTVGAVQSECDTQLREEIIASCPIAPIGTCGTVPAGWIGWLLVRIRGDRYFNPTLWRRP